MAGYQCSAFSEDGKYFSHYGADGKLKLWDTESGVLSQEYTPNLHLSSPCTCLTWMASRNVTSTRKKKKRKSLDEGCKTDALALGTLSGSVLLYSVASGDLVDRLEGGHNFAVNHIAWSRGCNLFSCDDQHIVEWRVGDKCIKSKWKVGTERVTCLLPLPDGESLLAAGNTIGLWNITSKQLIRRYTGHASQITSLTLVPGGETYFISSAKNDRHLNAWSLSSESKETNSVASFVMDDVAVCVSVSSSNTGSMVAVTRSGVLHLYRYQLNGKSLKPLKPKVTVRIASDSSQNKDAVQPIPIIGAQHRGADVLIAHGSPVFLSFEHISAESHERMMVLVRQDPRKNVTSISGIASKVRVPESNDSVEYVSPAAASAVVTTSKRGKKPSADVPMEERLDNLSLTRQDTGSRDPPRADNLAQLLMQGLLSKDRKILQSVLMRKDPTLITNTVMRLSVQCTVPLLKELVSQIQGKTVASQVAILWLKAVITTHAGQLLANPEVRDTLSPVLGLVETRLGLLAPLSRLRGRLDLLVDQIEESSKKGDASRDLGESLLVYQDQDSDEGSGLEDGAVGSDSEDHWEELSEMDLEEEVEEGVEGDMSE